MSVYHEYATLAFFYFPWLQGIRKSQGIFLESGNNKELRCNFRELKKNGENANICCRENFM